MSMSLCSSKADSSPTYELNSDANLQQEYCEGSQAVKCSGSNAACWALLHRPKSTEDQALLSCSLHRSSMRNVAVTDNEQHGAQSWRGNG